MTNASLYYAPTILILFINYYLFYRSQPYVLSIGAALVIASTGYAVANAYNPSSPIKVEHVLKDGGNALRLRDGRILEYFLHGDPEGKTIILALHGAQTTGRLFSLFDKWAKDNRVLLMAPTLPGFGLTSFRPGYTHRDWVMDVTELLKHLNVTFFHVLGTSLGSIHAVAIASLYEPSSCVKNVELYVAFGPPSQDHDPLEGSVLKVFERLTRFPLLKRLLEKYVIRPMLLSLLPSDSDTVRSIKYQWEGLGDCARFIYEHWDFPWKGIAKDRDIYIISGTKDQVSPPHNQKLLYNSISGSKLLSYEGIHEAGLKDTEMMAGHIALLLGEQK